MAIFKGTNIQLSAAKVLEKFGLKESDIRAINMDPATARAAMTTGDIDAAFGWEVTRRVVKTLVLAAKWQSDQEANPEPVYQLWTRSGVTFANFKEDLGKNSLKVWSSPLFDDYLVAQYNQNIAEAKRFGLIKNTFRFEDWWEPPGESPRRQRGVIDRTPAASGRTVLITGASSGIGRATALALARKGADLVLAGRSEERHPKIPSPLAKRHSASGRAARAEPRLGSRTRRLEIVVLAARHRLTCDMARISHVLFDFFGTLVSYESSWVGHHYEHSHRLLRDEGATCDYAGYRALIDDAFSSFERRALASLEEYSMDAVCEVILTRALERAPSAAFIERFRDTYLAEWNRGVRYIPGVAALLEQLSRNYCLALVSNTHQASVVLEHVEALQIRAYFSAIVTSIEHGRRKPSACIFERALGLTQGTAESAIYVGDSFSADYLGATQANLRCLLIDEQRAHPIPEQARLASILDLGKALAAHPSATPGHAS